MIHSEFVIENMLLNRMEIRQCMWVTLSLSTIMKQLEEFINAGLKYFLSLNMVSCQIRLNIFMIFSLYLEESQSKCNELILTDALEDNEISRDKQLLGIDIGKYTIIIIYIV